MYISLPGIPKTQPNATHCPTACIPDSSVLKFIPHSSPKYTSPKNLSVPLLYEGVSSFSLIRSREAGVCLNYKSPKQRKIMSCDAKILPPSPAQTKSAPNDDNSGPSCVSRKIPVYAGKGKWGFMSRKIKITNGYSSFGPSPLNSAAPPAIPPLSASISPSTCPL